MILIVIAIIISGFIIGAAIRRVYAAKMLSQVSIEQKKLDENELKHQAEIDKQSPPGSEEFKLLKAYIDLEYSKWSTEEYFIRYENEIIPRKSKSEIEAAFNEIKKRNEKIVQLQKSYTDLCQELGYEATDIILDNWPTRLRLSWEDFEKKKMGSWRINHHIK